MDKYPASVTMDDLVFEGRNKEYGAYELRKINPKYAAIATAISIAIFVAAVVFTKIDLRGGKGKEEKKVVVEAIDVELPPEEIPQIEDVPPPPPPPPPPPEAPQVKFVEMVVKKDNEVADKKITTVEEAKDDSKAISTVNKEGDGDAKPKVVDETPKSFGTGPAQPVREKEDVDDRQYEFFEISEQPEFPGGAAAMQTYIAKNIKYPDVALENGIEGTVTVEFVVDRDGSIKDVKVLKDPGGGLGKEAERVIKSMPKWKPGKQRDTAVKVKMRAPVRFRLNK